MNLEGSLGACTLEEPCCGVSHTQLSDMLARRLCQLASQVHCCEVAARQPVHVRHAKCLCAPRCRRSITRRSWRLGGGMMRAAAAWWTPLWRACTGCWSTTTGALLQTLGWREHMAVDRNGSPAAHDCQLTVTSGIQSAAWHLSLQGCGLVDVVLPIPLCTHHLGHDRHCVNKGGPCLRWWSLGLSTCLHSNTSAIRRHHERVLWPLRSQPPSVVRRSLSRRAHPSCPSSSCWRCCRLLPAACCHSPSRCLSAGHLPHHGPQTVNRLRGHFVCSQRPQR